MSNVTLLLIGGLAVVILAFVVWRSTRKNDALGHLKGASVSRQWLMQHQGEDRS